MNCSDDPEACPHTCGRRGVNGFASCGGSFSFHVTRSLRAWRGLLGKHDKSPFPSLALLGFQTAEVLRTFTFHLEWLMLS